MKDKHVYPTPESGKQFFQNFHDKGKITMLNLLKFKAIADYTNLEKIKPEKELTGQEAYQLYSQYTLPIIQNVNGRVVFYGQSKDFLIGPESEKWDAVILVEYDSAQTFIEFSQSEIYLKTAGHRTAALEDSRLLPMKSLNG